MDDTDSRKPLARDKIAQVYLGNWGDDAFQERSRARINWFVDQIESGCVLDIGCSEGILPILLGRKKIDVLGVDINPESIEFAKNLLAYEDAEVASHVTLVCKDFINTDWSGKAYDTIILGEIIEHFEKPEILINKAIELLQPGGLLLVTTPFGILPDPDHRTTFTLGSFYEYFRRPSLTPVSINVVDGYIRFAVKNLPAQHQQWEDMYQMFLPISENGLLAEQQKLRAQIAGLFRERQNLQIRIKNLLENQVDQEEKKLLREQARAVEDMNTTLTQKYDILSEKYLDLTLQYDKLEYIHQKITGSFSYKFGREISVAIHPVRWSTLLLPFKLLGIFWQWTQKKN